MSVKAPDSAIPASATSTSAWSSFVRSRLSILDGLSASSSVAALDEAHAKLDQEIEAVFSTMSAIKTRRNMLTPIARLHPEILALIFSFLANDDDEIPRKKVIRGQMSSGSGFNPYVNHGWIRVTHVCRRWRNVALDNPSLWGIDICSFKPWTAERIKRTMRAPIDIHYAGPYGREPKDDQFFKTVNSVMDRTRVLELRKLDPRTIGQITPTLLSAAPLLKSFSCAFHPVPNMEPWRELPCLPQDLFSNTVHRLRCLALTNVLIPLSSPLYDNIVDLALTSDPFFLSFKYTRDELLSLLGRIPKLQSLEIKYMIPPNRTNAPVASTSTSPSSPPNPASLVHLHRLRTFKAVGDIEGCLWLVQRLVIPPSAAVHLGCVCGGPSQATLIRSIISSLAPRTSGDESITPIMSLSTCIFPESLRIKGWRSCSDLQAFSLLAHEMGAKRSEPDVSVDFDGIGIVIDDYYEVLQSLCNDFYMDGAVALAVTTTTSPLFFGNTFRLDWRQLFGRLTAVEHVTANGAVGATLIQTLDENPFWCDDEEPDTDPDGWLFPKLRRLKLSRADLREELHKDEPLSEVLVSMLDSARECPQTNIEELILQKCGVDAHVIEDLRRLVPTVSWDNFGTDPPRIPEDHVVYNEDDDEAEMDEDYMGEEDYDLDWDEEPNFFDEHPDVDIHDIFLAYGMH